MKDLEVQSCAVLVGLLTGAIFFGGLWWTVHAATAGRHPAAWFAISLLLRSSLLVVGFHYIATDGWQAVLLCAGGVLVARTLTFRWLRILRGTPHAS